MKHHPNGGSPSAGAGGRAPGRGALRALLSVLVLLLVSAGSAQAQHRIAGRVTAATSGEPLPGVQVQVRGTSVGSITDAEGRYNLTAPSSTGVLVFRRIGYATTEAAFDGQVVLNATLSVEATELEGIVVVGYGEKARVNLTESVGTVSADQIREVSVATADQAIQGRVSGVQIQAQSGAPGAPVAVRVRGVGTIGNTQPLFVIDGVPAGRGSDPETNPLATLNPSDIESISVLKDASAAAVYGVQAANGVVLITTKRGKLGKPTIRYDGYSGVQKMPRYYDVNDTQAWLSLWQEAIDNYNAYYGHQPGSASYMQLPTRIRAGHADYDPSILSVNTDWQRVPLHENAPIANHNLSVSGASDQINYYISAGYFSQDAIQRKWDLERLSFRANTDFKVNDRIRFGETFSLSNQFTLRGQHNWGDGRIMHNTLRMAPIFRFRDPSCETAEGCPSNRYGYASNLGLLDGVRANQAGINEILDVEDRSTRILGGLHGEVDLIEGLTFRSQANLDYHVNRFYLWNPGYSAQEMGLDRNAPVAEESRSENYAIVLTNTLTYDGAFGNHNVNAMAGLETQQAYWNHVAMRRTNFIGFDEPIRRIVGGSGSTPTHAWAGENAFVGYLGRVSYNYGDRYLLTGTIRRDGASTFAPGHQWGTFPSVSAGWRVSQEEFFDVPWINELKIRGSWGKLGNSSIEGGAYPHLVRVLPNSTYTLNGWDFQDVPIPLSRFPNANLTWEETTTTDFGVEGAVLDNALTFAATYYDKSTGGFLLNVDLPPSSGFRASPFNSGEVKNTGVELELGYNRSIGPVDFQVGGNLTTVKNRLISLAPEIDEYAPPGEGISSFTSVYRTAPGHPVGYFYGFKTCGVFQTQAEAANAPLDKTISGRRPGAGDMCFQDLDGDGEITNDDRTYLGSSIPRMFYGLNFSANYGSFDFTAFFNGVQGMEKYNLVRRDMEHMAGGGDNQLSTTANRWRPDNPSQTMPRAIAQDPAGNSRFSDRWVEDASYLRLRTLQLGYTLPDGFAGTSGTRVYVSAQNVLTLTGYSGYDPEFTTSVDNWRSRNDLALFSGTDTGDIPQPRVIQIGVSTSF